MQFKTSFLQPNPRRSLPFARIYRQRRTASMRHCLPPLKKKRRQASIFLFGKQSLFGQHTAPLIPVDCLKSGNHLQSGTASCPSLLIYPEAFFSTTGFGSAFCLVKGALCNTGLFPVGRSRASCVRCIARQSA